jgi:hypothetical protein
VKIDASWAWKLSFFHFDFTFTTDLFLGLRYIIMEQNKKEGDYAKNCFDSILWTRGELNKTR